MEKNFKMPFGIHKGKDLENVPASYLKFLYDNQTETKPLFGNLKTYIEDNLDAIEKEAAKEKADFLASKKR